MTPAQIVQADRERAANETKQVDAMTKKEKSNKIETSSYACY
jgi:hypothetical protein